MNRQEKVIYLIRHCEAKGQEPEADLTNNGLMQEKELAQFFLDKPINCIISSPYTRALNSIKPLAEQLGRTIQVDDRLSERILCKAPNENWLEMLKATFADLELTYEGGESSKDAMNRGIHVIKEYLQKDAEHIAIVTHGNLMSLILHSFDQRFGFNEWRQLTNPDVYKLTVLGHSVHVERIWEA